MDIKRNKVVNERLKGYNSAKDRVRRFPKEFERQWADVIDKRFALILLASFILHFITALYFAINPPTNTVSRKDIERLQKRFASIVLDRKVVEIPEEEYTETLPPEELTVKEEPGEGGGGEGTGANEEAGGIKETKVGTVEGRREKHEGGIVARRKTREQISQEVSSKGLLGLLTSTGSTATGEGAVDLLEGVDESSSNLDNVFNQIDGLKRADATGAGGGKGSRRGSRSIKGSRVTSGSGIDNLISGRGTAKYTNMKRGGRLVVSSISAVANENGRKSESRDPDKVSAVVNSHNNAIQSCYQRELKRNPDLKGKLVVRFTIDPTGRVKDVKIIRSTLNNPHIERCVLNRIRRWKDFGAINPALGDATFRQVYTFGY